MNSVNGVNCEGPRYWLAMTGKGVSWPVKKISSLVATYLIPPTERFLIGDLRTDTPNNHVNTVLKDQLMMDGSEFTHLKYYGLLIPRLAIWRPESKDVLKDAMRILDSLPANRSSYIAAHELTRSKPFLLSETTSQKTLQHRKTIVSYINPSRYAETAYKVFFRSKTHESWSSLRTYAMKTLFSELLGFDDPFSGGSEEEISGLINKLTVYTRIYATLPIPWYIINRMEDVASMKNECAQGVERFLKTNIANILKNHANGKGSRGLISDQVIEKIKNGLNENELCKDPIIKSDFLVLIAFFNLGELLDYFSFTVIDDRSLIESVKKEIVETGVSMLNDSSRDIQTSILMDSARMPALHRLYLKCLNQRFRKEPIAVRYVSQPTTCGGFHVPRRTNLIILPPLKKESEDSEEWIPEAPFSAGARPCPGQVVAIAIFKALVVAHLVHLMENP